VDTSREDVVFCSVPLMIMRCRRRGQAARDHPVSGRATSGSTRQWRRRCWMDDIVSPCMQNWLSN